MKFTKLRIGATLVIIMSAIALFAPVLAIQDPQIMSLAERLQTPNASHPFGLDQYGADVFSNVVYGARVSLYVAFSVVCLNVIAGLLIGSIAGYRGGWTDLLIMRLIDTLYAFPGFLLALALVAVLGPSVHNLIFAMSVTGWTGYARMVRGEILHLKTREYVIGAVAMGARPPRIVVKHIWPNLFGLVVVQATFGMAGTVITESGLSFLGLGAPPSVPTWGSLLNSGRRALFEAPHISFFPGMAILLLVAGFHLLGDGLREWLSPRRH
jgi:peptide/nickel transport system permease protein